MSVGDLVEADAPSPNVTIKQKTGGNSVFNGLTSQGGGRGGAMPDPFAGNTNNSALVTVDLVVEVDEELNHMIGVTGWGAAVPRTWW